MEQFQCINQSNFKLRSNWGATLGIFFSFGCCDDWLDHSCRIRLAIRKHNGGVNAYVEMSNNKAFLQCQCQVVYQSQYTFF